MLTQLPLLVLDQRTQGSLGQQVQKFRKVVVFVELDQALSEGGVGKL